VKEGNRRRVGRNSPANGTVFKRSSLGGDNPASPSGPEAIEHLRRNSLAADGVTKNTRQLSAPGRQPTRARIADSDAAIAADRSNAWNEDALARIGGSHDYGICRYLLYGRTNPSTTSAVDRSDRTPSSVLWFRSCKLAERLLRLPEICIGSLVFQDRKHTRR
jgi:hypothetical protein